ncbi:FecR family protein [Dyadobacter soli]|uniref:FecR family protein n=1 Tax=Dyadobacter soli TaxID=659014 RepID=A0A1G7EK17_9BACT|nr:FecR family protein [Dyadobacter soli]SDE63927.1 FecR family protein [Dyadobacter soli]
MNNKEWHALLLKYREGSCTKEEMLKIHHWYEGLNADGLAVLNDQEKREMEERMLGRLALETSATGAPAVEYAEPVVLRNWWRSAAVYLSTAAAVLLVIGLWVFPGKNARRAGVMQEKLFVQAPNSRLITEENTTKVPKRLTLSDRSTVILEPGAKIVFPASFTGDKRTVQLTGDAFFQITRNPDQPFLVYSGKLITRVLGTSFRIKNSAKDQALEVEVVTGKVSVFENREAFSEVDSVDNQGNGVVLTPNQRVTYFPESRHLMTGLVPEPVKASTTTQETKMIFNDEKLEKIAETLQGVYGIEIVFENDRIAHCSFTGDLTDMQLYDKLALVCKSNGADYEVKGTRILINGRGCD